MMDSPRIRYPKRYSKHIRHSWDTLEWISGQAARLSISTLEIMDMLRTKNRLEIEAMPSGPATPPVNVTAPSYIGTVTLSQTLTGNIGTWSGSAPITYTYQWSSNGSAIAGATASTYVVQAADVGTTILFKVTATNASGTASASSV